MTESTSSACIAVVGSLLSEQFMFTEKVPDLGESFAANKYETALGGKGANAAMAAYRSCHNKPAENGEEATQKTASDIDVNVRMIGAVGVDDYATRFRDTLTKNGIDVSGIKTVEDALTGTCFCIVEEHSRENRLLYHPGATGIFTEEDFRSVTSLGEGPKPDLLISQLELKKEAVEQLLDMAHEADIDILLNAAPANDLLSEKYKLLAHLLVNESEAAIFMITQEFLDFGAQNVVLTLGEQGAYFANKTHKGHVPAFNVEVVEPTGAGDAFTGAYATDYVRQKKLNQSFDIERAVRRACAAGALVVGATGSQTAMPWAEDIAKLMSQGA
ncbi:hypothetical protein CBER1_04622 [Cercospora berteroae]|uniref:Ribokinase n=1 Tax=Cercospora berteroae TaxID=357750 RepID=A0A2S6C2C9_9PEZI|nr:hypothetical protein CBER1_04622 [Cercospora berteroae]